MKDTTFAAIDIGSNAVRLLIKRYEEDDDKLKKLMLLRVPLRLGFDVFTKGKVSAKKAENLLRLMKAYRQLMKIYSVDEVRACATSAMRDAENGPELIKEILDKTGIKIEIIAGEEEARIVYNNHMEYQGDRKGNYLYVDVGGGSTEINFLSDGELKKSMSFNIGTVRLLTEKVKPTEWERLGEELRPIAEKYHDIEIIGSGGNINKLYKLAKSKNEEDKSFSVDELGRIYHLLKPLSVEQRMKVFDLKADRADVIIPASEIFLHVASIVGAKRIIVPVIGVADGIIDGLVETALASTTK
ncbi:MAG: Ppx/GppA family phosphatase [Muribaculaceae bacterium]|nr:Ppx/GppA family phosphatase [Muribaculaceae bacterium]